MVHYTANKASGIYAITNIITGKIYVGQAQNIKRRWIEHKARLTKGCHDNQYLQRAWNKYGKEAFRFEVLEYCIIDCLNDREQYFIDTFLPQGVLYNIARDVRAPFRGVKFSNEHKRKISLAHRGKTLSSDTRRKISESHKGMKVSDDTRMKISAAGKGRKLSEEHIRKLSEANKGNQHMLGKTLSLESRQKISATHKGVKFSDEHKRKLSEARIGNTNCVGRVYSDETRRKISESRKGKKASEETRRKMSESHKKRNALKSNPLDDEME